ncbi:MAG: 4-hydroxy-tetrahydrodipicolinate reductase [Planctomycetes bacterium]|jgi:4-hydroxy-tetrahydrodipicolinate reductase|nr:4-hydroxy-tetrahydrodipicolinate reductase [Planctomycetota bacterium]MCL4731804.1 4-hydroxy-tetrahydrodipicolinate reductase [Planctomycetota bacterium]
MPQLLAVSGALGRMGRRIAELAANAGHTVVAPIDLKNAGESYGALLGDPRHKAPVVTAYQGGAEVMIDFSLPGAFETRLRECRRHKTAFVSGTTGLLPAHFELLDQAAQEIPVLWAANMSTGVNLLLGLVRQCAAALPESYDIEIVEMHHRRKVDAPSGTALALLHAICAGNGRNAGEVVRHGRSGHTGERTRQEIGMHTLRGGDVVGDHTVIFAAEGERIELSHKASSRDTFAAGALRAAEWIAGKLAGRYNMAQVLGL